MMSVLWVFLSIFMINISTKRKLVITKLHKLFFTGLCVLVIPLFYTNTDLNNESLLRSGGVFIGLLFLFSCSQLHYTRTKLLVILNGVLLLVIVQAVIALQQLLSPGESWVPLYGKRIYGTFFQANVLGSFIATGLALALMMFLLPGFVSARAQYERCRQVALMGLLFALSALLVWVQSRASWLGGIVVVVLFLFRFGHVYRRSCMLAASIIFFGVLLGVGVLLCGDSLVVAISHEQSNLARWSMLRDTLAMIVDRPWLGWGYGNFEYSFQHFRVNQIPPTLVTEIARHPHNEILLWIVEGGVVAFVGVLIILWGGWRVIRQAIHYDRNAFSAGQCMAGLSTALCIALIPMAIHTQLEFPFYLSSLHFLVFLLLLAMADRSSSIVNACHSPPPIYNVFTAGAILAVALGMTVITGFYFKGNMAIMQVENFGMEDVAPLKAMPSLSRKLHLERVVFDEQINALLTFNKTQDESLLESYSQWAVSYLEQRIDKNVYASLIQILRHQGRLALAEIYRRDAVRFFPEDARFKSLIYNKESVVAKGSDKEN